MPSSVLNNAVPYKILHKKSVDYRHLRVFSCLCFGVNPYASTSFDLSLFNLETEAIFVSQDVFFKEHVFPFRSQEGLDARPSIFSTPPLNIFSDTDRSLLNIDVTLLSNYGPSTSTYAFV